MIEKIEENIASFQQRGSNWRFVAVIQLEIHLVDYNPLSGTAHMPLPIHWGDETPTQ